MLTLFLLLFFAGCATTELHTESVVPQSDYQKTLAQFNRIQEEFLGYGREYVVNQKISMEQYRILQYRRTYLSAYFPCLSPQKDKFYDSTVPPHNDPLPITEYEDRLAALMATRQDGLWHMVMEEAIGFDLISRREAPFLRTVVCPLKFESHYDQGPIGDLIGGRKEFMRGSITLLVFAFYIEADGSQRLLTMWKSREIHGDNLTAFNAWYTRFGDYLPFLVGGALGYVMGH